jgi:hypothetical protein
LFGISIHPYDSHTDYQNSLSQYNSFQIAKSVVIQE